jgi:hypothetical protein
MPLTRLAEMFDDLFSDQILIPAGRLNETVTTDGALRRIKLAHLAEHVGLVPRADPSAARLRPEAPRYTSRSPGTASRCCSSAAPEPAVPSWPAAAAPVRARIRRPTLSLGKSEPTTQKQDPGRSGAGRIGAQMRPERGRPARRQVIDDMRPVQNRMCRRLRRHPCPRRRLHGPASPLPMRREPVPPPRLAVDVLVHDQVDSQADDSPARSARTAAEPKSRSQGKCRRTHGCVR